MPRGRTKGSKNKYRLVDIDLSSPLVNDIIEILKGGQANTEEILSVLQSEYPEFSGVMLRSIKNKINESDMPYLIGSDGDGYYLCDDISEVEDYARQLRTQAQTMLDHANQAVAKFKAIKQPVGV